MVRYGVPILLAGLYIAGASWIVGNEGRSYRESLKPPGRVPVTTPVSPLAREEEIARHGDKESSSASGLPPAGATPEAEPPAATKVAEREKPLPPDLIVPATPLDVAKARPTAVDTSPKPVGKHDRIEQWKKDPLWSQPHLTRNWDLNQFTLQQEAEIGAQLNELILQLNPECTDSGRERVVNAAEQLLDTLGPRRRRYRFFVLNSEEANAFSHPGGYVYVTRELLDIIPSDQPHLLEFVLGHEIAHVELQHALRCLNARNVRRIDGGTLQKLYLWIIPCGYMEEFEYEADKWVYLRMKQLHRTEHDCLHFLRLLANYARRNDFGNGFGKPEDLLKRQTKDPKAERAYSPIDNHLRSHPAPFERLKRLMKLRDSLAR